MRQSRGKTGPCLFGTIILYFNLVTAQPSKEKVSHPNRKLWENRVGIHLARNHSQTAWFHGLEENLTNLETSKE